MRPQDILILLKIATYSAPNWRYADIAQHLSISQSEVAEGLHRSMQARLVDQSKKILFPGALLEFLVHGLKYVFPVSPGPIVRGMCTAHAAPPLKGLVEPGEFDYVWPDPTGTDKGQGITPLYPSVITAAKADDTLYQLLAAVDALRVGRIREQEIAQQWLADYFDTSLQPNL